MRRVEALDDNALVMARCVPLGSRARGPLALTEANSKYEALLLRSEAQVIESRRELFEKYQELMHARTEYEALCTQMIPKAEQALQFSRRGFKAGPFSFLPLMCNRAIASGADKRSPSLKATKACGPAL